MIIAALLAAQLASAYPISLMPNTRVAKRCAPPALRSDDLSTYGLFPVDPFRGLSVPCRRRAQLLRACMRCAMRSIPAARMQCYRPR